MKIETVNPFPWWYKDRFQREKIAHIYKDLQRENKARGLVQVVSAKEKCRLLTLKTSHPWKIFNLYLSWFSNFLSISLE